MLEIKIFKNMNLKNTSIMTIIISFILIFSGCSFSNNKEIKSGLNQTTDKTMISNEKTDTAIFGAGCFWCVEAIFQQLKGVESVESGYTGGTVVNPTYKQVCTGNTGHAEVAKIVFDPSLITYEELLEVFWTTHDPTTLNQQGADVGTQYRSAIFYLNEAQRNYAEKSKQNVAPQIWGDEIVTEITPLSVFYPAEDYHQNYYNENSEQSYCKFVINPKLEKFRKKYKSKLKDQ